MTPATILGTFGIWTVLSLVILVTAWTATMFAKKHAALRHLIWVTAFMALLTIPAISSFVPARFVIGTKASNIAPVQFLSDVKVALPSGSQVGVYGVQFVAPEDPKAFNWTPILTGVIALWSLGLAAVLGKLLSGISQARTMREASHPKELGSIGISNLPKRKIDVRVSMSRRPPSALTWGTIRPIVILPQESASWSSEKLETVMLHELAHVRRYDSLSQLLALTMCAVYWFNPFVWLAAKALRADAEMAADDAAVQSGISPSAYAAELLRIATEFGQQRQPFTTIGVSLMKQSQIETRIMSIVDPTNRRRGVAKLEGMSVLALGAMAAVTIVSMRPGIAMAQEKPIPPTQAVQVSAPSQAPAIFPLSTTIVVPTQAPAQPSALRSPQVEAATPVQSSRKSSKKSKKSRAPKPGMVLAMTRNAVASSSVAMTISGQEIAVPAQPSVAIAEGVPLVAATVSVFAVEPPGRSYLVVQGKPLSIRSKGSSAKGNLHLSYTTPLLLAPTARTLRPFRVQLTKPENLRTTGTFAPLARICQAGDKPVNVQDQKVAEEQMRQVQEQLAKAIAEKQLAEAQRNDVVVQLKKAQRELEIARTNKGKKTKGTKQSAKLQAEMSAAYVDRLEIQKVQLSIDHSKKLQSEQQIILDYRIASRLDARKVEELKAAGKLDELKARKAKFAAEQARSTAEMQAKQKAEADAKRKKSGG